MTGKKKKKKSGATEKKKSEAMSAAECGRRPMKGLGNEDEEG